VPSLPRPVHHALMGLCRVDERILRSRDLPFGSSVLLAARPAQAPGPAEDQSRVSLR
jgi:hypothetical protein